MSREQDSAINIIKRKGIFDVLTILFDAWCNYKDGERSFKATTFRNLEKNVKFSTRTLTLALGVLRDFGLLEKSGRLYSITDLGLYSFPMLAAFHSISANQERTPISFNEKTDSRSWCRETVRLIVGAQKEVLVTAGLLDSFVRPEIEGDVLPAFLGAAKRKVSVRLIADPIISSSVLDVFEHQLKAEIRFLPTHILAAPQGILKPLFLEDFSQVMIADRTHWLYVMPYVNETYHLGKGAFNDLVIANYLADIFESFWGLSTSMHTHLHGRLGTRLLDRQQQISPKRK
jgi:hypothetical protein